MTTARHTLYAQRGLEFVAVFQVRLISFDVSGHKPLLRAPPGESTGGGKLATQHIVLQAADPSAPSWTVGSVNVATQSAKIRTYDCMRALHRTRFKDRAFPLDALAYQRFFDAAIALMKDREIAIEIESAPPELGMETDAPPGSPEASAERSGGGLSPTLLIAIVLTLALAAGAVVLLVLRGVVHL